MKNIALILLVVALNVSAQLIIKSGMNSEGETIVSLRNLPAIALQVFTNPQIIAGLMLYGIGAFFWMIVLSQMDLSIAYPMVSLSYILLAFLSKLLLDEPLTATKLIGTAVICLGVIIITRQ